jgi:hypothetical protein
VTRFAGWIGVSPAAGVTQRLVPLGQGFVALVNVLRDTRKQHCLIVLPSLAQPLALGLRSGGAGQGGVTLAFRDRQRVLQCLRVRTIQRLT